MYTPNLFGISLFFVWPLIILWFYKKYTVKETIFLSSLIAPLLLPAMYAPDPPFLPPLGRSSLTSLVLMALLFIKNKKNPIFKPGVWNAFFVAYLLTIVTSTLLNQDVVETGGIWLHASAPYDIVSNIILFTLSFMPFIFGRNYFNNPQDTEYMFKVLTIFALVYSVPMLYEIKMSPQLHTMIYGYFPGSFVQQMRNDGFRPVVFSGHGLLLAFWFSSCIIAAVALYKAKVKVIKFFGFKLILYLVVVLVLCKTVSAVIYIMFAIFLMYFIKLKRQITLSFLITALVFVYPINATSQFIKYSDIIELVTEHSEDRAQSLETRFENEERLIARVLERPYFGWSGWGRSRVYRDGRDITITDGRWVMQIGTYGVVGFMFYYLMLIYPIWVALKNYKYIDEEKYRIYFAALVIILAVGIFDSIPNAGMLPIHLLLGGALLGQAEFVKRRYLQRQHDKIRGN